MLAITKKEAAQAVSKYDALRKKFAEVKTAGAKSAKHLVRTGEIAGSAFACGVIQGRTGGIEILGLPFELWAGIACTAVSVTGLAGTASEHVGAVGDGALAAYLTTLGRGVGTTMRSKQLGGEAPAIAAKGLSLSPEEVAALSHED